MDRQSFDRSMERIMAFYKTPITAEEKSQLLAYLNATYEAVCKMDGFLFEQVTKELTKSLARGQRPVPSQMYAVYEKLREKLPKTEFKCITCNTTGFLSVWMLEQTTGATERFVKPCPDCRKNHPYQGLPIRHGWVEMDGAPTADIPESTKHFVSDFYGIKAENQTEALLKITDEWRSGNIDVRRLADVVSSQVERNKFNEERRKNKLVLDLVKSDPPAQARETSPESKNSAEAGSVGPAVLIKPDPKGFFEDGSNANDEDIPF